MNTKPYGIRAVFFRDQQWWIAQCLEYDIATCATTLPDLNLELERLLQGHLVVATEHGVQPFAGLPPAPKRFWKLFESARARVEPVNPLQSSEAADVLALTAIETRIAA